MTGHIGINTNTITKLVTEITIGTKNILKLEEQIKKLVQIVEKLPNYKEKLNNLEQKINSDIGKILKKVLIETTPKLVEAATPDIASSNEMRDAIMKICGIANKDLRADADVNKQLLNKLAEDVDMLKRKVHRLDSE